MADVKLYPNQQVHGKVFNVHFKGYIYTYIYGGAAFLLERRTYPGYLSSGEYLRGQMKDKEMEEDITRNIKKVGDTSNFCVEVNYKLFHYI